jgi:hypothetical protein
MTDAAGKKVVWILGSGFSVPLGGPTLWTLLSAATGELMSSRYAAHEEVGGRTAKLIRRLYHCGRGWPDGPILPSDGRIQGENLWTDPEAFLDYLDSAAAQQNGALGSQVQRVLQKLETSQALPTTAQAAGVARRMIAAECSTFVDRHTIDTEMWAPYRAWVKTLDPRSDTLVTFNYDLVLETAGKAEAGVLQAFMPGGEYGDISGTGHVPIIKLHGSVDWEKRDDKKGNVTFHKAQQDDFILNCPAEALSIATPGPRKRGAVKELDQLWNRALNALREADAVVFVGYRFPPSDAEARTRLLGAIRDNGAQHLRLHTVLGLPGPDATRLEHLLRFTCGNAQRFDADKPPVGGARTIRSFAVRSHPLYAQDFLTVWTREMLFA